MSHRSDVLGRALRRASRVGGACGVVAAVAGIHGCSFERSSGNSMETENSIAARELRVDSLIEGRIPSFWGNLVVPVRLDASNFDFRGADAKGLGIGLDRTDDVPLAYEVPYWDSVAKVGKVRVRLDASLLAPGAKIRLRWNIHKDSAPLPDPVATWWGISASRREEWTSLLLDDFEDGDDTNALANRSRWRLASVGTQGLAGPYFEAASGTRTGNALHFRYSSPGGDYTVLGNTLGTRPNSLRGLDSLVFFVKGSGTLHVALEHLANGAGPKAWKQYTLASAWTRISLRPQDFDPAGASGNIYNNYGWAAVRDSVTDLSFILQGGADFWLDDVRFHGVDQGDLR